MATARLYFHPVRGAVVTEKPLNPRWWGIRGGADSEWRDLGRVRVLESWNGTRRVHPKETLPEGFLLGEPKRQLFGMGGPQLVFGPLEKSCRQCGAPFVFTAAEQKHWFETLGFFNDATAVYCRRCRTARRAAEERRKAYETALRAVERKGSATNHLAVARAALGLLQSGSRAPLDRALGHCRRAQQAGAGGEAARLREQLLQLRKSRPG